MRSFLRLFFNDHNTVFAIWTCILFADGSAQISQPEVTLTLTNQGGSTLAANAGQSVTLTHFNKHRNGGGLYLFSEDKAVQRKVLDRCHFGGGCLNDTIIHLATSAMPFGGVGESGMGGYHGKAGFEAFSHLRSIVDKKTWLDMPVRYQPYTKAKDKMLRFFLK